MAQLENSFTCCSCKEIKPLDQKLKRLNRCKKCHSEFSEQYQQKNKQRNELNWIRPEKAKCGPCQEEWSGKFFDVSRRTKNGLQNSCKWHQVIKKKKHKMEIKREDFFKLLDSPCFYCGTEKSCGVDRLFSEYGYVEKNCVSCCNYCNIMKNDRPADVFLQQIEKIFKHKLF